MTLSELTQTHGWKNFMAKLYGIGASVVIIGALFKIMHWPFAGPMLIAGLGTEAIIFFFSAFEPLHEELDWTLVYPELAGLGEGDEIEVGDSKKKKQETAITTSGQALAKFDEMLEKTGGANLFEKLGSGLTNLTEKVKDMSDISNAALATNEYAETMKTASKSVSTFTSSHKQSSEALNFSMDTLSDSFNKSSQQVAESNTNFVTIYKKLTDSMDIDFTPFKDGNKVYGDHLSVLNKNLSALNAIFEMQLNEADIDKMMEDLQGSVEHSKKYNSEVEKLGHRLEALNNVYGKMLSAMNVKVE